jgi:hypothetical protein
VGFYRNRFFRTGAGTFIWRQVYDSIGGWLPDGSGGFDYNEDWCRLIVGN